MPENAGARVDTHVHPHLSELTKEELEAKRQAEGATGGRAYLSAVSQADIQRGD
jgi:hypothetical protein